MLKCFYCNKEIPEEELESHEIQCASNFGDSNIDFSNMIPCEICNELINFSEYEEHIKTCGLSTRRRRNQNFLRFFEELDDNIQIPIPIPSNQVQSGITILNELNNIFSNLPNTNSNSVNINVPIVNSTVISNQNESNDTVQENIVDTQENNEIIPEIHEVINENISLDVNDDTSDDDMPELIDSNLNEDISENNIEETENTIQNNQGSFFNLINSYYSSVYNMPHINNINNTNVEENIISENLPQSNNDNQHNEELNINSLMSELNNNIQILNNMTDNGSVYINPTFHINRNQDEYERLMQLDESIVKKGIDINIFSKSKKCEEEFCCPICFDSFPKDTEILEFKCGHNFCEECSKEWFIENIKCPVCSFEYKE